MPHPKKHHQHKSEVYVLLVVFFFLTFLSNNAIAQLTVRKVYLTRKEVFDSTHKDWFFAAHLANSLHTITKKYVIDDELLVYPDEELYPDDVEETERNLRRTGLFSNVKITVDTLDDRTADVYITTQDIWSTHVSPIYNLGGGNSSLGGFFREINLAGTGSSIQMQAQYRTENSIGWDGTLLLNYRRLFRSEYSLNFGLSSHKFKNKSISYSGKTF